MKKKQGIEKINKILWIRGLSCGHERPTSIAYLSGNYDKPNIGDDCYCRECFDNAVIVNVYKGDNDGLNNLKDKLNKTRLKKENDKDAII